MLMLSKNYRHFFSSGHGHSQLPAQLHPEPRRHLWAAASRIYEQFVAASQCDTHRRRWTQIFRKVWKADSTCMYICTCEAGSNYNIFWISKMEEANLIGWT
jgi:hypothetical protein